MSDFTIDSLQNAEESDVEAVLAGLRSFNERYAGPGRLRKVHLFLRDSVGVIQGGLLGRCVWEWLYVETLWIADSLRGRGLGTRLLRQAEAEAFADGRTKALLDTIEFQALPFYQSFGYEVFGVLDGFPEGFRRFYLRKTLVNPSDEEPLV
jgi:GNAT superfamily N-acetyltransferase